MGVRSPDIFDVVKQSLKSSTCMLIYQERFGQQFGYVSVRPRVADKVPVLNPAVKYCLSDLKIGPIRETGGDYQNFMS